MQNRPQPHIVSPAEAAGLPLRGPGAPEGFARRLRLLLPAETRSCELASAGALGLSGLYSLAEGGWAPWWAMLVFLAASHALAVMYEPPLKFVRTACVFLEFCVWAFLCGEAHILAVSVPGSCAGSASAALALSMAWSFAVRVARGSPHSD
jgi:hypothetical protein